MINERGSISISFLIISILIISSGIIVTQEFITPNNENNAETGLVLLNDEQDNQLSSFDSSPSYNFLDDEREEDKFKIKSSSSKSSSSSNSDSSDSNGADNPLESFENDLSSLTSLLENSQQNNSIDDENKNLESISSEEISDEIFKINGIEYIMRDGKEYLLSSSSSTYYINFDPALPSSVCENEKIDITVKGRARFYPDIGDSMDCAKGYNVYVYWCVYLMEDDLVGDDEVGWKCGSSKTYWSYGECTYFYFEKTFEDIDLSDWIIPDPGDNGEFYAKIQGDKIGDISTPSYDVYKEESSSHSTYKCYNNDVYWYDSCGVREDKKSECGSDSCGSWGSNYCKNNDVYHKKTCHDRGCSGSSCFDNIYAEEEKVQECGSAGCSGGKCNTIICSSNSDCGTNTWTGSKFCSSNDVWQPYKTYTCHNAGTTSSYCSSSTSNKKKTECGTSGYTGSNYCYNNDVYRDYVTRGCSGSSCTSSTSKKKIEDCGTLGCSGGVCNEETCTSHSTYKCYGGDVYWYDSCNVREEKKTECGTSEYTGTDYCYYNDVYRDYTTVGCFGSSCTSSTSKIKQEDCGTLGCSEGVCIGDGEIFTQLLTEGWNTVALTIQPENTAVASVLSSIEGKYDNVWVEVDGEWLSYSPTVLPLMNTLKYLEDGMTFQIEMNQAATLTVIGG